MIGRIPFRMWVGIGAVMLSGCRAVESGPAREGKTKLDESLRVYRELYRQLQNRPPPSFELLEEWANLRAQLRDKRAGHDWCPR